jgi:hypothetical protein
MEFSTVHLAEDSIHRASCTGRRSTADIFTTPLTRRMFTPGERDRTMPPAALTPMASTREQELAGELFLPGRQWLREARVLASVEADSMAEVVEATAEVAEANR